MCTLTRSWCTLGTLWHCGVLSAAAAAVRPSPGEETRARTTLYNYFVRPMAIIACQYVSAECRLLTLFGRTRCLFASAFSSGSGYDFVREQTAVAAAQRGLSCSAISHGLSVVRHSSATAGATVATLHKLNVVTYCYIRQWDAVCLSFGGGSIGRHGVPRLFPWDWSLCPPP